MGLDDMVNKAKDMLGGDQGVDEKVDQAAEAVKGVTPDNVDGVVDQVAEKAKDVL